MKIAQVPSAIPALQATPTAASAPAAQPVVPVDKVDVAGSDAGQLTKMAVQGISGLVIAIPSAYCGLAGGAMVGGLVGGALAPAVNALNPLSLSSAFSGGNPLTAIAGGLTTAWHGAGAVGQVGIILGTATALAGSLAIGSKIGTAAGRLCGLPKEEKNLKPINWKNWGTVALGTTLMTAGVAGGIVGGLALAGGAAAAGTVLQGVIQNGFSGAALAGVGHNMLVAGAVGGVISGFIGFTGGAALTTRAARNVVDPLSSALSRQVDRAKNANAGQSPISNGGDKHYHRLKGAVQGAMSLGGSALLGQVYPGGGGIAAAAGLSALSGGAYSVAAGAGGDAVFGSLVLSTVVGAGSAAAGQLGPLFVVAATAIGAGVGALSAEKVHGKRPQDSLPQLSRNTIRSVAQGAALFGGSALLGNMYGGGGIAASTGLAALGGGVLTGTSGASGDATFGMTVLSGAIALGSSAGGMLGPGYVVAATVVGAGVGALLANGSAK